MDQAVASARAAFDREAWSTYTVEDRLAILRRFKDLFVERREQLARVVTAEMGCPITQSRAIQVQNPINFMEYYLRMAEQYPFRSIRRHETGTALVTREPVGVVAAIIPWNMPAHQAISKIFPALLTGCTLVLKPVEQTALSALLIAEIAAGAGLPPGVLSVVPAGRDVGEHLVTHPGVDKVTFTGSTTAGRRIAALCGNDLRRVTLELGGKSAAVILRDADLDQAVEALRLGSFRNSGQICTLKTRVLAPAELHDDVVGRLTRLVDSMPVGDPHDETTEIGPMVTEAHRARVEGYIARGRGEGADLIAGGGRPEALAGGWYVEPTVFTRVRPDSTLFKEEIFGPVVTVTTYDTEDEAIRLANDSPYGLSGAVFTADRDRGIRMASRIRTGVVEVNGRPAGLAAPFGGFKDSGLGRENGPEGLDSFTELRSLGLPPDWADES
jgi:acyl-CoA reductase-like NAD-dependent aldehyde dehydrogenase